MHKSIALILVICLLALAGCAKPVPAEKAAYVGEWKAPAMYLLITQDGSVRYKRIKSGVTTSVDGPLKEFVGNDFTVGFWPFVTTFFVSAIPQEVGGKWKMTVDDVELTRESEN